MGIDIKITVFECDERDKDMVINDLLSLGVKVKKVGPFNDNHESYTFMVEAADERNAERFQNQASQILCCNTKVVG